METIEETSKAPSYCDSAIAYCQGIPIRNEIELRDASPLRHVTDTGTEAIKVTFGTRPVRSKIQGHVVTAIAPG